MEWKPDVLPGFEQLTLELTPDDEGPVVATLVRRVAASSGVVVAEAGEPEFAPDTPEYAFTTPGNNAPDNGVDVLYIHGWVDYFHQKHLAYFFESLGYRFYALDLRKYGRSLREWQTPGYVDTLSAYDEDINAALAAMGHGTGTPDGGESRSFESPISVAADSANDDGDNVNPKLPEFLRTIIESARSGYAEAVGDVGDVGDVSDVAGAATLGIGETFALDYEKPPPPTEFQRIPNTGRWLLLMGHSTGGLIASLWAAYNPGRADALVLNSPWLEFQTGNLGRRALEGPVRAQARIAPMSHLVNPDPGYYVKSISNQYDGEWEINPDWKPVVMWPPTAAWMAAIFRAQDRVALGLDLDIPVLVLLSAKSTWPVRWTPELLESDQVITVDDVAARAPSLGHVVTTVRLPGALHDVTLSTPEVRANVWAELTRWLAAYIQ